VRFVAEHAGRVTADGLRWGVEPICAVLSEQGTPIAPSTYYEHRDRVMAEARAGTLTPAAWRDVVLCNEIHRVWTANYRVYGARKVWLQLNREGVCVARCTVERLMRELGLDGARRGGKKRRTTIADPGAVRPADLVQRRFTSPAPDCLWVADFTYCSTWSGTVYVAFVIDAHSRRILGWRAATSMKTTLVLDALEMAFWTRARHGVHDLTGLIQHTDAGSQGGFNRSSQRLDRGGVDGQAGGVDDGVDGQVGDEVAGEAGAAA
jgi:putative transposase